MLNEFNRKVWLMVWVKKHRYVDILDSDFVGSYIDATNAKHFPTFWGAYKCPMLGRDLSSLAKCGALKRWRNGLPRGSWQPGFPRWVWTYELGLATNLYLPKTETNLD